MHAPTARAWGKSPAASGQIPRGGGHAPGGFGGSVGQFAQRVDRLGHRVDHAVDLLPNAGIGLARLEMIIASHIGVHPKALLEYAKQDIRINCICPGSTRTPMLEGFMGGEADRT